MHGVEVNVNIWCGISSEVDYDVDVTVDGGYDNENEVK